MEQGINKTNCFFAEPRALKPSNGVPPRETPPVLRASAPVHALAVPHAEEGLEGALRHGVRLPGGRLGGHERGEGRVVLGDEGAAARVLVTVRNALEADGLRGGRNKSYKSAWAQEEKGGFRAGN